jgi:hypothetical protein
MFPLVSEPARRKFRGAQGFLSPTLWFLAVAFILCLAGPLKAQRDSDEIQDITGKYHFLSVDDTLGLLEEEGVLKGYIDVYQTEEESDAILSYNIVRGTREKDRVEFKTNKIHGKYYRFRGKVQRGSGHEENDPDYLRLVGDVEIVTVKSDIGDEAVQRMHVVLKSFGKSEREEE